MLRLLLLLPLFASSLAFAQLAITPASLPSGNLGTTYAASAGSLPTVFSLNFIDFSVTGSSGSFSFSVIAGSLPPGLSLGTFGSLRGAPTQQGTFNFRVRAVNGQQQATERNYSITVGPPFSSFQTAFIGSSFDLPAQCPSFDTSYTYSTQGNVPAGLSVSSFSGGIRGTPLGPSGQSTFTWLCIDSSIRGRVDFSFNIQPMPKLSFTGQVGANFFESLTFPGGAAPFLGHRVSAGTLPAGVDLDSRAGTLTGIPTAPGVYSFEVQRTDRFEDVYRIAVEVTINQGFELSIEPERWSATAIADGPSVATTARVTSGALADGFALIATTTSGGRWLSVTPARGAAPSVVQVKVDPAGLAPGRYAGAIEAQSASIAGPTGRDRLVVDLVVRRADPMLSVLPAGIEEAFRQGAGPRDRTLRVANAGGGALGFSLQASTANGGSWLRVSPSSGTASGSAPASPRVTLDPTGLLAGTYRGAIEVQGSAGAGSQSVPVTMTVTGAAGLLQLSQTGMSFRMEQGSSTLPGFFFVREALGRSIAWRAAASTTSGGPWLVVSPSAGTTGPQSSVDVAVSASRLAPGRYFGSIAVSSDQAPGSPQSLTVALQVDPPGTPLPPVVSQKGLAFVAPPMLSPPLVRGVFVGNPTARIRTLRIASSFPGNPIFFTATTPEPRIPAGGRATLQIRVNASQLVAGIYRGFIDLAFEEGGAASRIEVLLVVSAGSAGGPLFVTEAQRDPPRQGTCTPASLQAVVVEPGDNFAAETGQPVPIEAFVVDDCGNVPADALVTAQFTNADDPISLRRNSRGGYSGLWTPIRVTPRQAEALAEEGARPSQQQQPGDQEDTQITIQANQINVNGTTQVGGTLSAFAGIPTISPGGAVSAASFASRNPLPPGAFISIFGANLAPALAQAGQLPLPTELNTVSVTAAGQAVPLQFVSPGQINGVLPFGLGVDSAQQIVVRHGNALSTPESISVSQAQPAVFTQNLSGSGPGIVVGVRPDGSQFLVGPSARLKAGDVAVVYCAGLGLVDQPVEASQAAPTGPLARTLSVVSVKIGGADAPVSYAGLAPGFAGLYQINASVQAGTPSGASIPLEITANGLPNPAVTVAVE